ncbi:MAG: alpha/beta fold hydrolase [Anaerolineae bacterium]
MNRVSRLLILGILIASVASIAAQSSDGPSIPIQRPYPVVPRTVDDPGDGSDAASDIAFIDSLRSRSYGGGEIEVIRVLQDTPAFTRYLIQYPSDGLMVGGFMNVPKGVDKPYPAVIVAHGYVNPNNYAVVNYTAPLADALARAGYLTVHPNYRNHTGSDSGPNPFRAGYAVDVLNLAAILKQRPDVKSDGIGIFGHSMGGGVALKALVVGSDIRAAVLYGAMSGDETANFDAINRWSGGGAARETGFTPDADPDAFRRASPINYLDAIQVPVQIHHGGADNQVPPAWSVDLDSRLEGAGKNVELFTYPGAPHFFPAGSAAYNTMIQRVIRFFDKYLYEN